MQNAECRRIRRNDFCILHSAFCISSYLHKRKLPRTRINGHRLLRLVPRRQDGDPNDHDECKMQNADGFDATTSAFCILPSAFRHISTNENSPEPGSMAIASSVSYHGGRMVIRTIMTNAKCRMQTDSTQRLLHSAFCLLHFVISPQTKTPPNQDQWPSPPPSRTTAAGW